MFFALGLTNAWRNRGRTALGIVSMGIAAMIFLSSTTLSQGYPAMAFMPTRQMLGGDIILLPGKFAVSREDMAGGYIWKYGIRSLDDPNPAMGFDTIPYTYGALQGYPVSGDGEVTQGRFEEVVALLQADPSVTYASIRRSLPFLHRTKDGYIYGFLDARDIDEDVSTWDIPSVVRGSYLSEQDQGFVGVAVAGWVGFPRSAGGALPVEIPKHAGSYLDYEDPLVVTGMLTGVASFVDGEGVAQRTLSEPAVFVSETTLRDLARAAGYADKDTYWGISVTLRDMATSENVAALLRRQFPDFTVFPASQLSAAALQRSAVSAGVPMDMRKVTQGIAFATAALLSATNLTIMMLSRKTEIGILRALGATAWDIACMVLTESIWISLLGAFIGTLVTQPAILWQLLSNKVGQDVLSREVGSGIGRSMAFAAASGALFGLLPVTKALRVTPAQVLRGE